ncbi:MAG: type III-A CRISPR-associated protein Csm2 [Deltaproteobacteria bacterium]|nr:type III-A CRISPR-associated protein Csm2 [Deltaproteobacteria bacterium]MBW1927836.1 type III-A CRISPR-associated protein Csm2 [Deltaproteobacteria bacterium]MBW2026510.1 type III-A CRISPR-associated protein Csm2 [Deltaproteobacteria bacterium]MBW2126757.1 type III-A CRISPR-associated protein Csm2 [Deltaproteobacteria bacterium]
MGKIVEFWKDKEKSTIDPKLFSEKAEKLARILADDHKGSKGKKANKRTQLRKFYDEVLRLDSEARAGKTQWERILPLVHMLTAKAAYAKGRDLVSNTFLTFIKDSVSQIQEQKDLMVFANFFEALMGFYRQHGPSN